ncbi:MAG TPA: NAD-dependent epimerase/dehydratase family protein [Chthoniobacterales bacterium]
MPRLLIAGCGYLGEAVADLFLATQWQVEGWAMSQRSVEELKFRPARAVDISNLDQVRAAATDFDAVIHAASTRGGGPDSYRRVYLNGLKNLLECFPSSRILFASSTSVYAQASGESVTEESAAEPKTETGKILREAEDIALVKNGIVIRLGGIYGPDRSALLKKFLGGEAVIDPANDRFVNEIHRDDAAAAIQLLLTNTETGGEIYNVVDNEPMLLSECYRWLAVKLNRPLPPVGKSIRLRKAPARQASKGKRGDSNKRVSNAKLRARGWTPRYPNFASGMEKSVLPSFARELA